MRTPSSNARIAALAAPAESVDEAAALLRAFPHAAVPLSRGQWSTVAGDLPLSRQLAELRAAIAALMTARGAAGPEISSQLRPAALRAARAAERTVEAVGVLASLKPPPGATVTPAGDELASSLRAVLLALAEWLRSGASEGDPPEVRDIELRLPLATGPDADPLLEAFGVPLNDLRDHEGVASDARLLAHWRGDLGELRRRHDAILEPLTPRPPRLFTGLAPVIELLITRRPVLAWTAARFAVELIESTAVRDPRLVEQACLEMREREEQRAASHRALRAAESRADRARTEAESALSTLAAYKKLAESHGRAWGWALLRLRGAEGSRPMIGALRRRLAQADHPSLIALAEALLPSLRNADAHEDAYFDEVDGVLVVEGERVAVADIRDASVRLRAQLSGFEVALAAARTTVKAVGEAYAVKPRDSAAPSALLDITEQRYGHAGLKVWTVERDRDTVRVILDGLEPRHSNPCFLATVQANEWLAGVSRWQIGVRGRDEFVIDLPARVVAANFEVFNRAGRWFSRVPPATFLPCITWSRLAVESPADAMCAAAWLALNDAQDAIDQVEASGALNMPLLARRLGHVAGATVRTLDVMPRDGSGVLQGVVRLLRDARFAVGGPQMGRLSRYLDEIWRRRSQLPVPAVLPTLDPRPLDVMEQAGDF